MFYHIAGFTRETFCEFHVSLVISKTITHFSCQRFQKRCECYHSYWPHTRTHRLVTRLMLETLAWGRGLRLRLSRLQQRTHPLPKTMDPLPQHPLSLLCSTMSSLMSKLCTRMLVFLLCASTQGGCVTEKKPPSNECHVMWLVQHGWNGDYSAHVHNTHYTLSSQYIYCISCYLGNI